MVNIAISGVTGRMGRCLIQSVIQSKEVKLTAAIARPGSHVVGLDAGEWVGCEKQNVAICDNIESVVTGFDVLIDFTTIENTLQNLTTCHKAKRNMVIGTTGFNAQQRQVISNMAKDFALVLAPNMSIGVNLCFKLLELTAKTMNDDIDIEIIEAHHRHKVDAPSGTALAMGEVIAKSLGRDLKKCAVYGREGHTGERKTSTIGFETIRAGDIVGEHTVMFAGIGERIEISHKASSRMTFAKGAVLAAKWLKQKNIGQYDMQDVLGFS